MGGEFLPLQSLFQSHGISPRVTCPYSHPQNKSIEGRHLHIVETRLSLLAHASIPQKYWVDAFQMAIYLINRPPAPVLQEKSPFEILMGCTLNYSFLKVFDSLR